MRSLPMPGFHFLRSLRMLSHLVSGRSTIMQYRRWASAVSLCSSALLLAIAVAGCATGTFRYQPLAAPSDLTGVQTKTLEGISVSVAILTDEQARSHFGADLGANGAQAIWVSVRNSSPGTVWLLRNAIDPDVYPPDEVATLVKGAVSESEYERLRQRLRDESVRLKMLTGMVTEGYVFTPRAVGGRYIDIRLVRDAYEMSQRHAEGGDRDSGVDKSAMLQLRFGFALPLPDGVFDYERLDTEKTYAGMTLPDLDENALRDALEKLPCCAKSADGDKNGDPLNVVIIGDGQDVLNTLSRCGWSFTHRITLGSVRRVIGAAVSGDSYPVAPVSNLYLFGRKQDFALQRARASIAQRNHMRLWLAPFRYGGRQVWVSQISRDIGIKLTLQSPSLTTHIIDPEVDVTREYLLHSLLAEGFVGHFGFVAGAPVATRAQPMQNLTDDPYFSDGMRLVVILAPDPIPYDEVRNLLWEQSSEPLAEGQTEAAGKNVRPVD